MLMRFQYEKLSDFHGKDFSHFNEKHDDQLFEKR